MNLSVSLIQTRLHWERPADNRAHFDARIDALTGQTDLIVLPETFASGFTQEPAEVAETMDGPTVAWMRAHAESTGSALTGSLAIREGEGFFNRMVFVAPDGEVSWYDKRHLFAYAGEDRRYRPGSARTVVDYRGWRLCLQICYDLRFPVWSRFRRDYDALIYVANWPSPRRAAWRILLQARAVENQCYVVGVNRVGRDGNGIDYAGDSMVCNPLGETIVEMGARDDAETATLDMDRLLQFREEFPFWRDADEFSL